MAMSKEMEKLIEEFIEIGYEPRRQYRTVLDARRRAPAQIRLILSAFRDGRLDEELGVVARGEVENGIVMAWYHAHDKPGPQQGIRYPLIALRPLTGTEPSLLDKALSEDGGIRFDLIYWPEGTGKEEE